MSEIKPATHRHPAAAWGARRGKTIGKLLDLAFDDRVWLGIFLSALVSWPETDRHWVWAVFYVGGIVGSGWLIWPKIIEPPEFDSDA